MEAEVPWEWDASVAPKAGSCEIATACRLPALLIAVDSPRKRSSWWSLTFVHTKAMNVGVPNGQDNAISMAPGTTWISPIRLMVLTTTTLFSRPFDAHTTCASVITRCQGACGEVEKPEADGPIKSGQENPELLDSKSLFEASTLIWLKFNCIVCDGPMLADQKDDQLEFNPV